VKQATGGVRVVVFDHTIRRREHGVEDRTPGIPRQPVTRIHGDYTEVSGPQRVRDLMGEEADDLLGRRFAIVNVWRPIRGPLYDAPLAVCDAGSLADGDLVAQDLIYRDRKGEIYGLTYNPAHRWYYAPAMSADEVLLLKCFDSRKHRRTCCRGRVSSCGRWCFLLTELVGVGQFDFVLAEECPSLVYRTPWMPVFEKSLPA
jgi:hypothetical protein